MLKIISCKLDFSSMWIENIQMFKGLEKAEEPGIKLPTFAGSSKKQGNSRKTSTSVSLSTLKPLTVQIINCGKLLKRCEYQTILPVSWETHIQVKKQQLEPYMEQLTCSKLRQEVWHGCLLSFCLFNLHAEHILWNAGLDELQAGIKITRRNINNLRYADDTTLMVESKEELKSLLMRVKKESEKPSLELNKT